MSLLYTHKKQLGGTVSKGTNEFMTVSQPGAINFSAFDMSTFNTSLQARLGSVIKAQGGADVGGVGNGPFGSEYGDSGAWGNYGVEAAETFGKTMMTTGNPWIAAGATVLNFGKNALFHKKNEEAREERNIAKFASINEAYDQTQVSQARGLAGIRSNKTQAYIQRAGELSNNNMQIAKKGAKIDVIPKDNTIICSTRNNVCKLVHKSVSPFHHPIFRRGGHIVNKYKKNVILDGPSHEEPNDTGHNDDNGLPIVQDGGKVFEVESDELILNTEISHRLEKLTYEYLKTKNKDLLIKMGKIIKKEIESNTYSYSDKYKELNHV